MKQTIKPKCGRGANYTHATAERRIPLQTGGGPATHSCPLTRHTAATVAATHLVSLAHVEGDLAERVADAREEPHHTRAAQRRRARRLGQLLVLLQELDDVSVPAQQRVLAEAVEKPADNSA